MEMSQKTICGIPHLYEEEVNRVNQQIKAIHERGELLFICSKCETFFVAKNISKCPECGNTDLL